MKKSILSLLFAVATAAALVTGCGGQVESSKPAADATIPFPGSACIVSDKQLETAEGSELSFFYEWEGKKYEVQVIDDAAEVEFNKDAAKYMAKLIKQIEEQEAAAPPAAQ
jgi:hypothetical protein